MNAHKTAGCNVITRGLQNSAVRTMAALTYALSNADRPLSTSFGHGS
ncbi:hypothetical protein [Sphingomonas endolithica]|nr:hypothetical protein [Sphingomonas sp. ZFBP2030]